MSDLSNPVTGTTTVAPILSTRSVDFRVSPHADVAPDAPQRPDATPATEPKARDTERSTSQHEGGGSFARAAAQSLRLAMEEITRLLRDAGLLPNQAEAAALVAAARLSARMESMSIEALQQKQEEMALEIKRLDISVETETGSVNLSLESMSVVPRADSLVGPRGQGDASQSDVGGGSTGDGSDAAVSVVHRTEKRVVTESNVRVSLSFDLAVPISSEIGSAPAPNAPVNVVA